MGEISQAETYLLKQIRQGCAEAWAQLVERYQGRLLAFAQTRLNQRADAEDVVQEALIDFLRGLNNFRGEASLETYLFTILRRKIINCYRGKSIKKLCLIQDVYGSGDEGSQMSDVWGKVQGPEATASSYFRRDEQHEQQREALTAALGELVNRYKSTLKLRELQVVELIFYGKLANKDVAKLMKMKETQIALIKHRCLQRVQKGLVKQKLFAEPVKPGFENLLTETWEAQRLSCPKRSTIGAYLLGTLDAEWQGYVGFHLNELGCHFCRANLEDMKRQSRSSKQKVFQKRVMESTVGFLSP